jgi:hypothetical protein
MGYNYYIPGRNDPFMKGGPCDLYHIILQAALLQLLRSRMSAHRHNRFGACMECRAALLC